MRQFKSCLSERRSMMKRQRILTSIIVTLIVLLFSAGPVLAKRVEFTGYRERAGPVDEGTKIIVGCNLKGPIRQLSGMYSLTMTLSLDIGSIQIRN